MFLNVLMAAVPCSLQRLRNAWIAGVEHLHSFLHDVERLIWRVTWVSITDAQLPFEQTIWCNHGRTISGPKDHTSAMHVRPH